MTDKYLITTDNWFIAPNGSQYSAVWGEVTIIEDTALGLKTNRNSTNWYAKVGSEENHVIIAGCQIHYAVKCENMPNFDEADEWCSSIEHGVKKHKTPSRIYKAI